MKSVGIPELEKAVREYYEYNGERNMHAVRFVENKPSAVEATETDPKRISGYTLLLVRFIDSDGEKISALMEYTHWADGHWDVTEDRSCPRKCEERMVRAFETSEEYA